MKKILFIIAFCNLALGQLLNNQEPELKPLKQSLNISALKVSDTNIGSTVVLDQSRSTFVWEGGLKFAVSNHDGNLKMSNGSVSINDNVIAGTVVIDMNSMTNNDLSGGSKERLIGHLKSPDFFHVTKFPKAVLKIKSSKILEKLDSGKYKMLINGDMTIKDKTNPISFEAIVDLDSNIKTAEGKLAFDRSEFNVQYRSEMHLDNPNSFWNKVQTSRDAAKDKVIRDLIEINFNIVSLPGMLSK
tara:strand:- start:380 stop:1111 length:732 start_codon:yes stop_codon:yes gene_type:complete